MCSGRSGEARIARRKRLEVKNNIIKKKNITKYNMSTKHLFRIIGLRVLEPGRVSKAAIRDAQCMQKALYGRKEWLYFYEGASITDSEVMLNDDFAKDHVLYDTKRVSLSISAIVGRNGTGKSSTVDMVIRFLNNLAAAVIGRRGI